MSPLTCLDGGDGPSGGSMERRPLALSPPFTRGKEENGAKCWRFPSNQHQVAPFSLQ